MLSKLINNYLFKNTKLALARDLSPFKDNSKPYNILNVFSLFAT